MGDTLKIIEGKIGSKKVMIFSKPTCSYCKMAKDVFKQYLGQELDESDYEVLEINGKDCDEFQNCLAKLTGARTVPRVFINGKCIGGGSEVKAAHSSGQLRQLLAK